MLCLTGLSGVPLAPTIENSLRQFAARFEHNGWSVSYTTTLPLFENTFLPFVVLAGPALLKLEDKDFAARGELPSPDEESSSLIVLRSRIANELPSLQTDMVLDAWQAVHELRIAAAKFFNEYDVILAPVSANEVPLVGDDVITVQGQQLSAQHAYLFSSATNVLGLPALSFAPELSPTGLPVGLQLIGPRFGEDQLFAALREVQMLSSLVPPE
jgi:Asp-tRNA(Asn)/Glu-tRNA(Gln) amidotransferase A subunit family amidase